MVIAARDIMTAAELAEFLRVKRMTIYRLLKKSAIPAFRVGAEWRFQREAVESWIKAGGDSLVQTGQPHGKASERAEQSVKDPF